MLIVCPSCTAGYNIDAAKLGEAGRTVRCAACDAQWFVTPEPVATVDMTLTQAPESFAVPAPPADPFDEEAIAREWANAENWTPEPDPPAEAEAGEPPPETEPDEPSDAHAAGAAALAAAAAAAAAGARAPWWRRLLRRRPAASPKAATVADSAPSRPHRGAGRGGKGRRAGGRLRPGAVLRSPLAAGLAGFALIGGLLWQREFVVRHAPVSAPAFAAVGLPVNLAGLVFAEVRSVVSREGEGRFLTVEGQIRSVAGDSVRVPPIEVAIRGGDGRTVYTWSADPPRRTLRPGESLHFRTRLATPPEAGRDVEVRFADGARSAAARN